MPTICDIKAELREKGIKGVTGLNKGQLLELLKTGKSFSVKPEKKEQVKKEQVYQGEPYVPFKEKIKIKVKKRPVKKESAATKKEPLLLTLREDAKPTDKAPPLSNKSLVELYKMSISLKKSIDDNVNTSEVEHSKRVLEKVKKAFKYNRTKFMDKIAKSSTAELSKMKDNFTKIYSRSKDEVEKTIIGGQIAEITKLI